LLSSRPLFGRSRTPEHGAKQVKRVSADLFRKANEFWHRHLALFSLDHPDYGVRPTDQVRKLTLGEPRFFACFRQNRGNCMGGWASQSLKNDLCSEFRSDLDNPIVRCLDFLSAASGLEWLSLPARLDVLGSSLAAPEGSQVFRSTGRPGYRCSRARRRSPRVRTGAWKDPCKRVVRQRNVRRFSCLEGNPRELRPSSARELCRRCEGVAPETCATP
jgi:hypothetical protein